MQEPHRNAGEDTSVAATAVSDATLAAKAATSSMPINSMTRADPMAPRLVSGISRPGGGDFACNIFNPAHQVGPSRSKSLLANRLIYLTKICIVAVQRLETIPCSRVLLIAALRLPETVTRYDLPAAIRTVSKTPAEIVGLSDRGEIATGKRADLIQVHRVDNAAAVRRVWSRGDRVA
jgi:N-acetylglucosamine-6-phosphate deacetylase